MNTTKTSSIKWLSSGAVALLVAGLAGQAKDAKAVDMSRFWPMAGSGVIAKQAYALKPFHQMSIVSGASVDILPSDTPSVKLEVDENIEPHVSIVVRDDTLVIEDQKSFKPTVFRITVWAPANLRSIATSSSAAVRAVGWHATALSLAIGERSAVSLPDMQADALTLSIGDKGVLKASGAAKALTASLGGSTALDTQDLQVDSLSLDAGGSCQASVWATSTLTMKLGGSCAVRYFGRPKVKLASGGSVVVKDMGDHPGKVQQAVEAMPSR